MISPSPPRTFRIQVLSCACGVNLLRRQVGSECTCDPASENWRVLFELSDDLTLDKNEYSQLSSEDESCTRESQGGFK